MKQLTLATGLAALIAVPAWANNGTQLTGFGAIAQGMGGVGLAFPQDAIAAANNPAGMAFVGNRFDIGTQVVMVWTDSTTGSLSNSGSSMTPVPEFGLNWQLSDRLTFGISSAAAGGAMNYDNQIITGASNGTDGLFLSATILPTVSYRVNDALAVGVSLAASVQGLKLKNFPGVASDKMDWATGFGWRAGFMWTPNDRVSVGGLYAAKIRMGSFDAYRGDILAAVDGKLDVPEQLGLGVAVKLSPRLTVGADYLHIKWADTQFNTLFGYRNQDVLRLGASYEVNEEWTLRGGASIARRHITSDSVTPNLVLSAINPKALTLGATRRLANGGEVTMGVEYDFGGKLNGTGPSAGVNLDTDMAIVSVSYGMKF